MEQRSNEHVEFVQISSDEGVDMSMDQKISGYSWQDEKLTDAHSYLLPSLDKIINSIKLGDEKKIFDLGCGNGSVANWLSSKNWDVTGVDPSAQGILLAKQKYPNIKLHEGSAYDDLSALYGQFPLVVSLEVVEHVYAPRDYAKTLYSLVNKGGSAIVSTPYHGYFKNLALAVTGKMDNHFTALWDHGHIKFWSISTLSILLKEAGFKNLRFYRVGRIAPLAKSMIVVAERID